MTIKDFNWFVYMLVFAIPVVFINAILSVITGTFSEPLLIMRTFLINSSICVAIVMACWLVIYAVVRYGFWSEQRESNRITQLNLIQGERFQY